MKKVFLIRHGLPDFPGGQGMCLGITDIPMGAAGLRQAAEMAKACRRAYSADIGIGITGTFGNLDPNNPDSVAGKVFFAFDKNGEISVFERDFSKKESRFEYKIAAAKEVADELEKLF